MSNIFGANAAQSTLPKEFDIDFTKSPDVVQQQVSGAIKSIAALAIEAKERAEKGALSEAEYDRRIGRMAEDVKAIQTGIADVQSRAAATNVDGDTGPLAKFVGKSGQIRLTAHPEMILGAQVQRSGLLDSPTVHGEWHANFKTAMFGLNIAARMAQAKTGHGSNQLPLTIERAISLAPTAGAQVLDILQSAPAELKSLRDLAHKATTADAVQRIFTGGTDSVGGYLIPDEILSPTIEMDAKYSPGLRLSSDVIGSEVLSTARFDQVFMTGNTRPYIFGAATNDDPAKFTASTATFAKNTTQPVSIAIRYVADINSAADSILPSIAALSPIIARDLMLAREDMFHNGDTAATHQDTIASWNPNSMWGTTSGAGGSGDHRRAIRGIRARAIDASATVDMNGALTRAYLTGNLAAAMGVGHADASRRVLFTSTPLWLKSITKLDQVSTVDKFGQQATILGVRLGAIDGIVLETSPFISDTMNASGVYDGVTTTKGVVTIANIDRFRWLIRQGVSLNVVYNYENGTVAIVATMRLNLRDMDNGETGTSVKNCAALYNITP